MTDAFTPEQCELCITSQRNRLAGEIYTTKIRLVRVFHNGHPGKWTISDVPEHSESSPIPKQKILQVLQRALKTLGQIREDRNTTTQTVQFWQEILKTCIEQNLAPLQLETPTPVSFKGPFTLPPHSPTL